MALEAVPAQAGHASIESTRIYLHLADDWLASQYRKGRRGPRRPGLRRSPDGDAERREHPVSGPLLLPPYRASSDTRRQTTRSVAQAPPRGAYATQAEGREA